MYLVSSLMAVSNDSPMLIIKSTLLPFAPHPKQWKPPVGNRVQLAVRSAWKGQRILARLEKFVNPTILWIGTFLHLSIISLEVVISIGHSSCFKVGYKPFLTHFPFVLCNIHLKVRFSVLNPIQ